MTKISVIVPVYNVEKYLLACLNSIKEQTFSDIEVIMVNDGSTDGSQAICEKFVDADNRFKLINQENQGLSGARNTGLLQAKSDFVYFVDSDDWIEKHCLESLYMKAIEYNTDLVVCNVKLFNGESFSEKKIWQIPGNRCIELKDLERQALIQPCWVFNKLYSKKFLDSNGIKFIKGLNYEDVPFFVECMLNSPSMYYIEESFYIYRVARPGSITNEKGLKSLDIYRVSKVVEDLLKRFKHPDWFDENLKDWRKWNFAWMYTRLPNYTHTLFMFWLLFQDRETVSNTLTALGMRLDVIQILGIAWIFVKYHNEKTTVSLFGLIPLYMTRRLG